MVEVAATIQELRTKVQAARGGGRAVGLVPTMGALHDGHARLVETARAELGDTGLVIVSIFVNPSQFGPHEDFDRYPRTFDADLVRCAEAGADVVFAPAVSEVYPLGFQGATFVEVPGISSVLEGAIRPGHFRGVATVVLKLLAMVQPDVAWFGAKDFQQHVVIRRMVADLNLPVTIRAVPTVREPDGLAMSSRNRYLDATQRQAATVLSRALDRAVAAVRGGERDANRVRQILRETIESEVAVVLDYAEVADAETLDLLTAILPGRAAVALLAARLGTTRLIDNAVLTGTG